MHMSCWHRGHKDTQALANPEVTPTLSGWGGETRTDKETKELRNEQNTLDGMMTSLLGLGWGQEVGRKTLFSQGRLNIPPV